jgi:hypothetical protein
MNTVRRNKMRRLLVVIVVAFVGKAQGGAITAGSVFFAGQEASAHFSGQDFSATIRDGDVGPYPDGGFTPFSPGIPIGSGVGYGSAGFGSGVTYNGVFYNPQSLDLPRGSPYASSLWYSVLSTSPTPTITGPGVYPVTVSVQMSFCLNDPTGSTFYCESDTGIATGGWNATFGNTSYVFLPGGLDLSVVAPEPSTLSGGPDSNVSTPEPSTRYYVGFVLCFGFLAAALRRTLRARKTLSNPRI